jgi:uncharacterized protein DUF3352
MRNPKRPVAALLLVSLLASAPITIAQKRTPPRTKAPVRSSTAPATSFDNLLAADSYKIYVEVRNVGQLVNSGSFQELIEPVLKLASPPKEFKTAVKWLSAHAEAVMTSRMMVAAWPTAKNIPTVLVAIEFENAEEAAKFEPQLNDVLQKVLPPQPVATPKPTESSTPAQSPTPNPNPQPPYNQTPASPVELKPDYHVARSGTLVFVTSTPLTIKNLRPPNTKPLNEDPNFRTACDRFNSESIFAFLNITAIDQEEKEQQEKAIESQKAWDQANKPEAGASPATTPEEPEELEPQTTPTINPSPADPNTVETATLVPAPSKPPDELENLINSFSMAFFGASGQPKWPEAIGLAGNLDASSFDLRALFVTAHGEKLPAIPFFPMLVSGPVLVPESPSILPADTELYITMSLDLPKVYADFVTPRMTMTKPGVFVETSTLTEPVESPFAFIEKKLGTKLNEALIPLLGNEVVFSMPLTAATDATPTPTPAATGDSGIVTSTLTGTAASNTPSPTLAFAVRDKEGMRALLPKLVDAIGFKGASGLAQTQKREDTEIVSYANVLSYAFIGNFLVVSPDPKNINHVVDSYLKHETLSADISFKNFTRWQPRQIQGQVYVSPALMESYGKWANEPSALISEQTREFLTRFAIVAEPVTYSLSNEGNGPLHQIRVPKNLLLMAVAGLSGETNVPPEMQNERVAMGNLIAIAVAEARIKKEKGSYTTLEELISQQAVNREVLDGHGYKFFLTIAGESFEAVAVPIEYGKTGKVSFFINESSVLRGGDHGGAPATFADKPIQ